MSIVTNNLETLDSRLVLKAAIELTGRSKYAFAKAAGMPPSLLNRYLHLDGSQMGARKLQEVLLANGIDFKLKMLPESESLASPQSTIQGGVVLRDFMKASESLRTR